MSPALATTFGMALYAVAILPVIAAAVWHNASKTVGGYATLLLALAAYQTGIFHGSSLTPTDTIVRVGVPTGIAQCQQILEVTQQSGLGVNRSDPAAPKLTGPGADQIPPEIRDVLLDCFNRQANAADSGKTSDGDSNGED